MKKLILISLIILFIITFNTENFRGYSKKDCYNLNKDICINTKYCGWCDNKKTCLPGDEEGPYFDNTCNKWITTPNYWYNSIHNNVRPFESRPYNWNYPNTIGLMDLPAPIIRSALLQ